jgi:hypothetical protein
MHRKAEKDRQLADGREWGGGGGGAESYDSEKAWFLCESFNTLWYRVIWKGRDTYSALGKPFLNMKKSRMILELKLSARKKNL